MFNVQLVVLLFTTASRIIVFVYCTAGRVDGEQSCSVVEVGRRRKGVVADISIPEDELVVEYKVSSN